MRSTATKFGAAGCANALHVCFGFVVLAIVPVMISGCSAISPASAGVELHRAADSPSLAALSAPVTTVFLVRHAEKEAGRDPGLTAVGQKRAEALAALLRDAGVRAVHSTGYARTQQTAAPLAARLGLSVTEYDPRALGAVAEQLRAAGGTHVVVGHSNTTPALVGLLGGNPDPPIVEKTEFDRLEMVTISADGTVTSVRLRVGAEPAKQAVEPKPAASPAAAPDAESAAVPNAAQRAAPVRRQDRPSLSR
ncbi:MAG: phosphoglycerate mutase family protein [Phycisphaerales bacterium]